LQLHIVKHHWSVYAGARKVQELTEAVVLVPVHNAAQQASIPRVSVLSQGVDSLLWRELAAVVIGLVKLLVVLVVIIFVMVVEVHGVANQTFDRQTLGGQAQNTR
jgi:hypothetical protein